MNDESSNTILCWPTLVLKEISNLEDKFYKGTHDDSDDNDGDDMTKTTKEAWDNVKRPIVETICKLEAHSEEPDHWRMDLPTLADKQETDIIQVTTEETGQTMEDNTMELESIVDNPDIVVDQLNESVERDSLNEVDTHNTHQDHCNTVNVDSATMLPEALSLVDSSSLQGVGVTTTLSPIPLLEVSSTLRVEQSEKAGEGRMIPEDVLCVTHIYLEDTKAAQTRESSLSVSCSTVPSISEPDTVSNGIVDHHNIPSTDNKEKLRQARIRARDSMKEDKERVETTLRLKMEMQPNDSFAFDILDSGNLCQIVEKQYQASILAALNTKVVHVISSNLDANEMATLHDLSRSKFDNHVKIKIKDSYSKRISLCITPMDSNGRTCFRTSKVIRCALSGIPIVSPDWLIFCRTQGEITTPETGMFAHSMPVHVTTEGQETTFGIAKLAVLSTQVEHRLLQDYVIFIGNGFSAALRKELMAIAHDAGARTALSAECVSRQIGIARVVLICPKKKQQQSRGNCLPESVYETAKTALVVNPSTVQIVNESWIFESIASVCPLDAMSFPPDDKRAKELFDIACKMTNAGKEIG